MLSHLQQLLTARCPLLIALRAPQLPETMPTCPLLWPSMLLTLSLPWAPVPVPSRTPPRHRPPHWPGGVLGGAKDIAFFYLAAFFTPKSIRLMGKKLWN